MRCQPSCLHTRVVKRSYQIHSRDLRSSGLERRPGIWVRYACDYNRVVLHNEPEDLVESILSELGYRDTSLRTNALRCSTLELSHIELSISLAELAFLVSKPAAAGVAKEIFIPTFWRGADNKGYRARSAQRSDKIRHVCQSSCRWLIFLLISREVKPTVSWNPVSGNHTQPSRHPSVRWVKPRVVRLALHYLMNQN